MTSFLKRNGREDGDTGIEKGNVTRETEIKVIHLGKPRTSWIHQKLEEAKKDSFQNLQR